jgi:hypothetical protein
MGCPDGLLKNTWKRPSLKLGRPDGHDGRPNGLGFHRILFIAFSNLGTAHSKESGRAANGTANGALGI